MTIKIWDYLKEYENEKHEILDAVEKVLSSGHLVLGESVRNFEQSFARYCGTTFGIGVNSGTDALFLALRALDIGPGDEVITVANTAVPTVSAIVSTGARSVFVNIDPEKIIDFLHIITSMKQQFNRMGYDGNKKVLFYSIFNRECFLDHMDEHVLQTILQ